MQKLLPRHVEIIEMIDEEVIVEYIDQAQLSFLGALILTLSFSISCFYSWFMP